MCDYQAPPDKTATVTVAHCGDKSLITWLAARVISAHVWFNHTHNDKQAGKEAGMCDQSTCALHLW